MYYFPNSILFLAFVLVTTILLLIICRQRFFFKPDFEHFIAHPYEEFYLSETGGHVVHVKNIQNEKQKRPIVFFHGNGSNGYFSIPMCEEIADAFGTDVYILDYPHFGRAKRELPLSEESIYLSGDELMRYVLARRIHPILIGMSMGGCVASRCAIKYKCKQLVIINSPVNFQQVVKHVLPFGLKWISYFVSEFKSIDDLSQFTGDGIVIQAKDDNLIPIDHAHEICKNPHLKLVLVNGTHNEPDINWREIMFKLIR